MGALFLILISSIERLFFPSYVDSLYVIIIGLIAFVINSFSALLLGFHNHNHDLNIKAAYLHLLSDAGISLGVVAGGIIMHFYQIFWIDPLISIIFSLYILRKTIPVLKDSYLILMESTPSGIDIAEIKRIIKNHPEVISVHDIHVWSLSSKDIYLSAHVVLRSKTSLEKFDLILEDIKNQLDNIGIHHITIQPEIKGFKCDYIY